MPLTALILLVVAAALHTGWNLLVKRAREKQIFTWWAMVVGAALFAPLLALGAPLPASIWPYVLASALVEMAAARGIDMPIAQAVHAVISGLATVDEAIEALLARPLRAEV